MPTLLSKDAFAKEVSISIASVNRAIARGEIRVCRIGSRVLIPAEQIGKFVDLAMNAPAVAVEKVEA